VCRAVAGVRRPDGAGGWVGAGGGWRHFCCLLDGVWLLGECCVGMPETRGGLRDRDLERLVVGVVGRRIGGWGVGRWVSRLVAVLGVVCVVGCGVGGSSAAGVVVVRVGGRVISKASVDHWVRVIAVVDYELRPAGPVPAWVIPDPPLFTACVAHLRATTGAPVPGTGQLKNDCEARYVMIRQQALEFLITGLSLINEGEARGVHPTSQQVTQHVETVRKALYGSPAVFKHYLASTGETIADQRLRAEIKLPAEAIEQQILTRKGASTTQRDHALVRFDETFPKEWAAKTSCSPGYVVPNCKQYKGPQKPQIVI
jgi:hypothetical protein